MNAQTRAIERTISVLAEVIVGLAVVFAKLRGTIVLTKRGPDATPFLDRQIAATDKPVKRNSSGTNAHLNFGWPAFKKGDYERATKEYSEVLKLNPDHAVAHYNLGLVAERQGWAEKYFRWPLEIPPDGAEAKQALMQLED